MASTATAAKPRPIAALAVINSLVLGATVFLGPLGATVTFLGTVGLLFILYSEMSFVVLITSISHFSDDMGYDFDIMRAVKWLLLGAALLVTLWQFALRERWPSLKVGLMEKYMAVFLVWGLVCLCFADSPMASIAEFGRMIAMYVVYLVTKATIHDRRRVYVLLGLLTLIVYSSSLYSLYALSQGHYFRVRGFTNNPGAYAQILSFIIPFVVVAALITRQKLLRYFLVTVTITGVLAMFLAWSRASIIGAVIQVAVFLVAERKYRMLAACGALAAMLFITVMTVPALYDLFYKVGRLQAGSTHRTTLWKVGLQAVAASPVVGHGLEMKVGDVLQRVYWNDLSAAHLFKDASGRYNPHNQYLQSAVASGIPGLVIFIAFMYYLIRNGIRDFVRARGTPRRHFHTAMLSVSISLVFISFFANAPMFASGSMANYFWITLGMVEAVKDHDIAV